MKNVTWFLLIILIFSSSCNSNKSTAQDKMDVNKEAEIKLKEGFTKGIIVLSNIEGDCPVTIKVISDGTELYYDPINLNEEFNKDGEKIWFQYGGLRRMNRCEKASPISITAIEKRED